MDKRVTTERIRRRKHDEAFKHELVERSLQPGASVAAIAQDNGINANLLFKWRREHLRANGRTALVAPTTAAAALLPVKIESPMPEVTATPTSPLPASRGSTGSIEIDIGGARVRLRGAIDETSVRVVLQALCGLE